MKLANLYTEDLIQDYKNDEEIRQVLENMKKQKRKERPFLSFMEFMKERFEAKRSHFLEIEAKTFLNSNLPLSFYSKIVVHINTYYEFLKIVEHIVRINETKACLARNSQLYYRHIQRMKQEIGPIIDKMDAITFSLDCLKKFVKVWNCSDYDELFKSTFLDMEKIDSSGLEQVTREYYSKLKESRGFLLQHDPYVFQRALTSDPNTSKMFGQILSSSLDSIKF
jgi:hypothetical protein